MGDACDANVAARGMTTEVIQVQKSANVHVYASTLSCV